MTDTCELVAEYRYGDGHLVRVYACYETPEDFVLRQPDFFDCYDADGACLNEGDPWYTVPTWQDCAGYVSRLIPMLKAKGE